jgi:hypothetical protein
MAQVNPSMALRVDKMTFDAYQTKDGKWVQLLGVDYLKHVPIIFKVLGISGRAWGSLAFEILTTPSVLKDPLQLVPLAFGNITQSIKKEILTYNWDALKELFDSKGVWYTYVAVSNQVFHDEQCKATNTFLWPKEEDVDVNYVQGRVNNPCQVTSWKNSSGGGGGDEFAYGQPDSTKMIGRTTPIGEWKLEDFVKERMK